MERRDPFHAPDDASRAEARALLKAARHGALAYLDAATGTPGISRIAVGLDPAGQPVTLISQLSTHHAGLCVHPVAALMVGEPGPKGDPLTHPRLMLRVEAMFVARGDPDRIALRAQWLSGHPKSTLYVDFADFDFVRLAVLGAVLNGGFGRATRLAPEDLAPQVGVSPRSVT
jgi:heme iron utilization protein